ncbi:hypothetical protein ACFXKC_55480 [Streptomyces sp. NPDC059340]|uniref:hypothetical protein n=1 Tax=Streptomyces sp. NPDC059340 TaxID=3346806 RepID=UPI00369CAE0A
MFAALAEFIRELIVQGTHEGLAAARARGERIGRPPVMTEEQIRHARALLVQPENTHLDREAPRRLPYDAVQIRAAAGRGAGFPRRWFAPALPAPRT